MSAKVKRDIAGLAALAVASIYFLYGEGNPQLQKSLFVLGWAYADFLLLQGYLYIRYRKEGL